MLWIVIEDVGWVCLCNTHSVHTPKRLLLVTEMILYSIGKTIIYLLLSVQFTLFSILLNQKIEQIVRLFCLAPATYIQYEVIVSISSLHFISIHFEPSPIWFCELEIEDKIETKTFMSKILIFIVSNKKSKYFSAIAFRIGSFLTQQFYIVLDAWDSVRNHNLSYQKHTRNDFGWLCVLLMFCG